MIALPSIPNEGTALEESSTARPTELANEGSFSYANWHSSFSYGSDLSVLKRANSFLEALELGQARGTGRCHFRNWTVSGFSLPTRCFRQPGIPNWTNTFYNIDFSFPGTTNTGIDGVDILNVPRIPDIVGFRWLIKRSFIFMPF